MASFCLLNIRYWFLVLLLLTMNVSLPAFANDSSAVLAAGGIELKKNEQIEMRSEYLFISQEKVEVEYIFVNTSAKDISTIVAFPMPDIEYTVWDVSIPNPESVNFMNFEVWVEGQKIETILEEKALDGNTDITSKLHARGLSIDPSNRQLSTEDDNQRPSRRGISQEDRKVLGIEETGEYTWTLKRTFYWQQNFPAGKELQITHRYSPSVGGSVGNHPKGFAEEIRNENFYKEYCVDEHFLKGLNNMGDKYNHAFDHRIEYILTTGGNWAGGRIGDFRLVIDKGNEKNLISFCADGVKKISPTQFEVRKKNYKPENNLSILIFTPAKMSDSE